jgi:predicted phosphoribosyltransferase
MRYRDRRHAGALLGARVAELGPSDPVVFALPRGGVPVAYEVARALNCPLDVLVVRKLGVPRQRELAMGAIAEGGAVVRNEDVIDLAGVSEEEFESVVRAETLELEKRLGSYRQKALPVSPEGRTAVVVDDGLATGSTALAGVQVLLRQGAAAVWLAVPVAPPGSLADLEALTDRLVVLSRPRGFGAVGAWYQDFTQTSDEEVEALLEELA